MCVSNVPSGRATSARIARLLLDEHAALVGLDVGRDPAPAERLARPESDLRDALALALDEAHEDEALAVEPDLRCGQVAGRAADHDGRPSHTSVRTAAVSMPSAAMPASVTSAGIATMSKPNSRSGLPRRTTGRPGGARNVEPAVNRNVPDSPSGATSMRRRPGTAAASTHVCTRGPSGV